jgi:hypothetical protein
MRIYSLATFIPDMQTSCVESTNILSLLLKLNDGSCTHGCTLCTELICCRGSASYLLPTANYKCAFTHYVYVAELNIELWLSSQLLDVPEDICKRIWDFTLAITCFKLHYAALSEYNGNIFCYKSAPGILLANHKDFHANNLEMRMKDYYNIPYCKCKKCRVRSSS